jgi:hypothetical protein
MKKITYLLLCFLVGGLMTANAQYSFPAVPGPVFVENGSPVTLNINDMANAAGVPSGMYATFSVSVDWVQNAGGPYSSEADLTMTTSAGSVLIDPPTSGSAGNADPTTMTFEGAFSADYDPDVDGTLDIVLNQSWAGSSADWSNIVVTIIPALTCTPPVATVALGTTDCGGADTFMVDVDVTDLGDGTPVIFDGTTSTPVAATGVYSVGPYPAGATVSLTLQHGADSLCDVDLGDVFFDCPPPNDTCAGVVDLGTETSPLTASTEFANNDFMVDCLTNAGAPDMVYSILVPNGSTIEIGQTSNSYDSKHRLAYGGSCPGDTLIACTDDPDTQTESWTNSTGMDQTVYWVQSAYTTGNGDFTLAWNVFACSPPVATYTVVDDCDVSGGFLIDVDVTDLGSATSLTVSDDQGSSTQAVSAVGVVQFGPYTNGTDVVITVGHDQDGLCDIMSGTLTQTDCPPANDDFANAEPVVCDGNYTGSTALATLDEDDAPDGFGADLDAPNVWYSYDSSVNGAADVTVSLCGSGYDTAVLVYTGTSGNLTAVAGNDDSCGLQSEATFSADGVQTYYITVTGYNPTSTGSYTMDVTCVATTPPPANDECANAEPLAFTVTTSGTTVGATQNGAEEQPTCDTFGAIADVWYSVEITGGTSDLNIITTITGTSDQANVAVYSACGGLQADSLGCSDDNGGETLTVNALDNGVYYIRVWSDGVAARGEARVEGTFDIVADVTLSTGSFESEAAFTYYPNPVKNTLTLNAQNTIESVRMYNVLGQEVLSATPSTVNSELDMSNLQDGAYFVKVTIADVTKTIKVIKQ